MDVSRGCFLLSGRGL